MNDLKDELRKMNYDTMALIDTIHLKKVRGGTENPIDPEDELVRNTQASQSTAGVCLVKAVSGDLV